MTTARTTWLPPTTTGRLVLALAVLLHLGVGVFYVSSGLLAPPWAVVALCLVWAVLLVWLVRLGRRRAPLALVVPPLAFGLWFTLISLGEALLGWTA